MTKLEELKAMVSVLQRKIEALEKPKQWEPAYDPYTSSELKAIGTHSRLIAYVKEFGGDWEANWESCSQEKCCVNYSYSVSDRVWEWNNNYSVCTSGTVYMSRDCAKDLAAKLNSGEVVL